MYKHYIKTFYQQVKNNRSLFFINIFGLAIAMAVCFVIFLYAYNEFSFDAFHKKSDNLYRINLEMEDQGRIFSVPATSAPIGPDLKEEIPEVKSYTRIAPGPNVSILKGEEHFNFSNNFAVENNFFDFFSFELIKGNPATVFKEPYSIVLSKKVAEILFPGNTNPVGKTLKINDRDGWKVTGIVESCPPNTHLRYDVLTSYATIESTRHALTHWAENISVFTYVELTDGFDKKSLDTKTKEVTWEKANKVLEPMGAKMTLNYFPITDIRLRSDLKHEFIETGTIAKVRWFLLIAIFILFIAGFNYVNLTIASSSKRAKETGLRKVIGADKRLIRKQIFTETLLLTALSFFIALLIAELILPQFNLLLGTELTLITTPWWIFGLSFFVFVIFFGTAASIYPAVYMAKFQPVDILKGNIWIRPGSFSLRKFLLTFQFVVSVGLIICTLVVYLQLNFFRTHDYGFDFNNLIAVKVSNTYDRNAELLKQQLSNYPWVESISTASAFPGMMVSQEGFILEGSDNVQLAHYLQADRNFFETLKASIDQGRFFQREDGVELEHVVVNQELVSLAGWNNPIGKIIDRGYRKYKVVGVAKDFHFESFHNPVAPLIITSIGHQLSYQPHWVMLRYKPEAASEVLPAIHEEWEKLLPDKTIHYEYVNQVMGEYYETENNFGMLFLIFTILAIIIAMLGVLGLSALSARQRMKEIAIRKVLGASIQGLIRKFSVEYLILVFIAAVIAIPFAYYLMDEWLAGFVYSISFPYWTLIASIIIVGAVCMLIASMQSLKATNQNPVNTLKVE